VALGIVLQRVFRHEQAKVALCKGSRGAESIVPYTCVLINMLHFMHAETAGIEIAASFHSIQKFCQRLGVTINHHLATFTRTPRWYQASHNRCDWLTKPLGALVQRQKTTAGYPIRLTHTLHPAPLPLFCMRAAAWHGTFVFADGAQSTGRVISRHFHSSLRPQGGSLIQQLIQVSFSMRYACIIDIDVDVVVDMDGIEIR
jgi:hypothetical protein